MQVEPCLPFPYTLSRYCSPLHSLSITPFPSLPSTSHLSLLPYVSPYSFASLLPLPPYSQPFPSPSLPPLPLITARELGSAIVPPASAGRARPPNAFLCNSQPKICKSVKSFLFFAWNSWPLHSEPLDFVHPAHPIATPLDMVKHINIKYLCQILCKFGFFAWLLHCFSGFFCIYFLLSSDGEI